MKLLLLSGGIESMALAHQLRPDLCVTIDYGQPAFHGERKASMQLCQMFDLKHQTMTVSLYRQKPSDFEDSFWPYRNQILISAAAANFSMEESKVIIYLGLCNDDIYRDCTSTFVDCINDLLKLQNPGVEVDAPAIHLSTLQLLRKSAFPPDLLGLTFSCHLADFPCGTCPGCEKNFRVRESFSKQPNLKIVSD